MDPMYNFKKNAKLYIVELDTAGAATNQHAIEIYSDITASQTFDEQSYKRKTLHALTDLHDHAVTNRANAANFSFTTPILDVANKPKVLTLGSTYSSGNLVSFDIYIQSDNVIYKLTKCIIESQTFNIEKTAILTVSVSGTASKLAKFGNVGSVTIPGTPFNVGTKTYAYVDKMNVSVNGIVLDSVAALNLELKSEISWYDNKTVNAAVAGTMMYPSSYVMQGRTLSGSVTQFLTSDNVDLLSDTSTNAPIVISIYNKGTSIPILEFNLASTVFTRRLNFDDLITRVYDFRLNSNTITNSITYKTEPALSLDFLSSESLDSRIAFTRSSTATRINSSGKIETVAVNVPRFDYDPVTLVHKGLLIEEQSTNLLTYSEQLDNAVWGKVTITISPNSILSPEGTTSADKIIEDTTNAQHKLQSTATTINTSPLTFSCYLKAGERTSALLVIQEGNPFTRYSWVAFNLSAGTVGAITNVGGAANASASITPAGNGWYRCSITTTLGGVAPTALPIIIFGSTISAYLGDGSSGLYMWGAQLEAKPFVTSYIPTVASQVTRSTDVAEIIGTNFSTWYNQSAGTMLCSFTLEGIDTSGGTSAIWRIDDTTSNNIIAVRQGTIIAGFDGLIITSGVNVADSNSFSAVANTNYNSAFTFETNYAALASNGVIFGPDTSLTMPTATRLTLNGGGKWLRSLTYYNTRLTDTQIQALSL